MADANAHRTLGQGQLAPLRGLMDLLGLSDKFTGDAGIVGNDPVIVSPHRLGEASATAQLLIGVIVGVINQERTGRSTDVTIDIIDALHYLHPTNFIQQSGHAIDVGADRVPINGLFLCRDGRYIMLEAGPPYAKLLNGYLSFFHCANDKTSFARAVSQWDSESLEEALADAGVPACRAFTPEEWLKHPQGQILREDPVIEIEKIGEGEPTPFADANVPAPLAGIRVLDFTHVLAGPRSARTLAEYGADVLHVSSPAHADTLAQHLCVNVGKRCTYLDLLAADELQTMHDLASEADVFTSTYRPTVNRRFRLLPEQLAAQSKRGMVCMSANAYGHYGSWRDRPGFDQNGQVASGFAAVEGAPGPPRFSPVFYLADLITGYLAAAGMMTALLRRATEGGSYHVKLSLTRSSMWVHELGLLQPETLEGLPTGDTYPVNLSTIKTTYGPVTQLAPALRFSNLMIPAVTNLVPYGSDPATWLA